MAEDKTQSYDEWKIEKEERKETNKKILLVGLVAFLLGSSMGLAKGKAQAFDQMMYGIRHVN